MRIFVVLGLSILLIGCKQKTDYTDKKISELEARVNDLESKFGSLLALTNQIDVVMSGVAKETTNMQALYEVCADQVVRNAQLQNLLESYARSLTNPAPPRKLSKFLTSEEIAAMQPRASTASTSGAQAQAPDGIPQAVYDSIVVDAQSHWPGNYEMQEFRIRNQMESYLKLHPR